jgi:hypothetical protein
MRVRLAFVVVCVVVAGGTAFGARGASTTVAFLRATGQTVCNYSVALMCNGTAWSAEPATGAFVAWAVTNGLAPARINPDDRYGASASATLGRTYTLPYAVPDVRVTIGVEFPEFDQLENYTSPDDLTTLGDLGNGNGLLQTISLSATHVDASSTGASCVVARDEWVRDREINGHEPLPAPGFALSGVITCVDADAQPVDVPAGRIQVLFNAFAGARAPLCLASGGPGCLHDPIGEVDMNEARMRGTATLTVEHA